MPDTSPTILYTNRTYAEAFEYLKGFVNSTNGGLVSDFTESNAGVMLISMAAAVIDIISTGQDFAAGEVFLSTCRTYEGALRFANSVGYVPRVASAATVTLVCDPLPSAVTSLGGTVHAGQVISVGGVPYQLLADVVIPASQTAYSFDLVQSQPFTETFAPAAIPFQKVTVSNGIVAQGSWAVYVGDATDPDNLWSEVDELLLTTDAGNYYQVSFDAFGVLSVTFGNGISGAIPGQTITVQYQTTSGAAGNLPVYGVTGTLTCTTTGGTSALTVVNSSGAANGGTDRESLAELKRNIPAYIRTNQRVVTLRDYEDFLLQQPGVNLAYSDVSVASYESNVVRSNVWGVENVSFTATSAKSSLKSVTPYTRYAQVSPQTVVALHSALSERTMVSVHNRVLRPGIAQVDVYAGDVRYDSRYDAPTLHAAINAAVVGVFQSGTGFTVPISEITNAIRDVPGVRRFNIERIVWDYYRAGVATGAITFSGNPADGDTVSINDGVVGYAFEFDSNSSVASGRVRVVIGANAEATATNLVNAINQTLAIRAYRDPVLGGPTVSLVHTREGDTFNIPIVESSSALTATGMSGGTYDRTSVREDRRIDQSPVPDPYPVGTYTVGNADGTGWVQGGVAPYKAMRDLEIKTVKNSLNTFDEQFLYNLEIRYDSGLELTPVIQAINLRRLVFDLVPDNRATLPY